MGKLIKIGDSYVKGSSITLITPITQVLDQFQFDVYIFENDKCFTCRFKTKSEAAAEVARIISEVE